MKNFNRYLEIIQEMKVNLDDKIMMILQHTGNFSDMDIKNSKSFNPKEIRNHINDNPNNYNFAIFIQDTSEIDKNNFKKRANDIAKEFCNPPCNPAFIIRQNFIGAQFSPSIKEPENEMSDEEEVKMLISSSKKRGINPSTEPRDHLGRRRTYKL